MDRRDILPLIQREQDERGLLHVSFTEEPNTEDDHGIDTRMVTRTMAAQPSGAVVCTEKCTALMLCADAIADRLLPLTPEKQCMGTLICSMLPLCFGPTSDKLRSYYTSNADVTLGLILTSIEEEVSKILYLRGELSIFAHVRAELKDEDRRPLSIIAGIVLRVYSNMYQLPLYDEGLVCNVSNQQRLLFIGWQLSRLSRVPTPWFSMLALGYVVAPVLSSLRVAGAAVGGAPLLANVYCHCVHGTIRLVATRALKENEELILFSDIRGQVDDGQTDAPQPSPPSPGVPEPDAHSHLGVDPRSLLGVDRVWPVEDHAITYALLRPVLHLLQQETAIPSDDQVLITIRRVLDAQMGKMPPPSGRGSYDVNRAKILEQIICPCFILFIRALYVLAHHPDGPASYNTLCRLLVKHTLFYLDGALFHTLSSRIQFIISSGLWITLSQLRVAQDDTTGCDITPDIQFNVFALWARTGLRVPPAVLNEDPLIPIRALQYFRLLLSKCLAVTPENWIAAVVKPPWFSDMPNLVQYIGGEGSMLDDTEEANTGLPSPLLGLDKVGERFDQEGLSHYGRIWPIKRTNPIVRQKRVVGCTVLPYHKTPLPKGRLVTICQHGEVGSRVSQTNSAMMWAFLSNHRELVHNEDQIPPTKVGDWESDEDDDNECKQTASPGSVSHWVTVFVPDGGDGTPRRLINVLQLQRLHGGQHPVCMTEAVAHDIVNRIREGARQNDVTPDTPWIMAALTGPTDSQIQEGAELVTWICDINDHGPDVLHPLPWLEVEYIPRVRLCQRGALLLPWFQWQQTLSAGDESITIYAPHMSATTTFVDDCAEVQDLTSHTLITAPTALYTFSLMNLECGADAPNFLPNVMRAIMIAGSLPPSGGIKSKWTACDLAIAATGTDIAVRENVTKEAVAALLHTRQTSTNATGSSGTVADCEWLWPFWDSYKWPQISSAKSETKSRYIQQATMIERRKLIATVDTDNPLSLQKIAVIGLTDQQLAPLLVGFGHVSEFGDTIWFMDCTGTVFVLTQEGKAVLATHKKTLSQTQVNDTATRLLSQLENMYI